MWIIDDLIQAEAARDAAEAQERSARKAMDLQRSMYDQQRADQNRMHEQSRADWRGVYDQQRADQAPWMDAGRTTLADLLGQMRSGGFDTQYHQLDPSQLANDPGFQFRMAEGQKALERSAAARGGLSSGGFMKGLARYSQGLASDEYQNAWGRNNAENMFRQSEAGNRFGRMSGIAGMGQNAAQSLGAFGGQYAGGLGNLGSNYASNLGQYSGNYANNMGNLYGAEGNAKAAGITGWANGIAGGVRSLGNLGTLAAGGGFPGIPGVGGGIPTQGYQLSSGGGGGYLSDLMRGGK